MMTAEARALCADLELLDWDDVAIGREITEVTAALLEASPQVTPVAGAPGMWWIGAHGFEGLGGERVLLHALHRIARRWHPRPRVAIADSCVAARAGTWQELTTRHAAPAMRHPELSIVPPGGCAAFLATAPLALIPMDEELRETLNALGLGTAGAFAALESEDVERRWGRAGLLAWRLARGEDRRRPVLTRVEARRSASAELAMPAETMEPVLFLVRAALDRLVAELVRDGRAAAALAITLTLDRPTSTLPSGGVPHTITRQVRPGRPLARVAPLFERCRALLDGWSLTAPVCGVTVTVAATVPLTGEQGDLLATGWHDPAALDAALARLCAELGPGAVVRPVARDEHRPERSGDWVEMDRENGPASTRVEADALRRACAPAAALRLLESPETVELEWSDGVPCAVWWRGGRVAVTRAIGPERLSGDWWKNGYRRDYWRCEGELGELLVYRDLREDESEGQWFLQGWYD